MAKFRIYNLFISHCWSYDDDYIRLINLLDNAPDFYWKNYSISFDKARPNDGKKELEEEIRKQIRLASAVLVIAGIDVSYRKWIQFEIDFADKIDKPIIGIRPFGSKNQPWAVKMTAVDIVKWSTNSIVNSIVENAVW